MQPHGRNSSSERVVAAHIGCSTSEADFAGEDSEQKESTLSTADDFLVESDAGRVGAVPGVSEWGQVTVSEWPVRCVAAVLDSLSQSPNSLYPPTDAPPAYLTTT